MHFEAGRIAYGAGRFTQAQESFQRAYELSGRERLLFNVAQAAERAGNLSAAADAYRGYLAAEPDAENAGYVQSRLAVLEAQVAEREANEARIAAAEAEAARAAEQARRATETTAERDGASPSEGSSRSVVGPAVLLAVGGGALVSALGVGLAANGQYNDLEDRCPGGTCSFDEAADIDRLRRMTLTSDALLAVGGAAAIGGLVWWLVSRSDGDDAEATSSDDDARSRASVRPVLGCGADGCLAGAAGTF